MMLYLESLQAGYSGTPVLHGVDLQVGKGEFVCLLGRNGVGKTTTLATIMGANRATAGRILIDGVDVTGKPAHVRAHAGVAYVPQGRGVFEYLSVFENLQVAAEAVPRRKPSIDEAMSVFPALKPLWKRPAGALSGGQQQQLAIARALVLRPRLLLLDEPTEGIQPSIITEIEAVLVSLKSTMAVLLVEQYLAFAQRLADRSFVMDRGRIVASGPTSELDRSAVQEHLAV